MVSRTRRMLFTLLALGAGIAIVLLLTYLGKQSRGPLANLLDKAGSVVAKVENNLIIEQRGDNRKSKLPWLKPYTSNIENLKHPKVILLGAYDNLSVASFSSMIDLEDSLKTTFPLMHIYTAWGGQPSQEFPHQQVQAIVDLGSVPVITWEPWLTDFDAEHYPGLRKPELRDKGGLADIAKGLYDTYIKAWAKEAGQANTPIFLRVGHEMNDPYRYPWGPQNNSAKDFVAAWRHIHNIFAAAGATNIIWIWSPHPSYGWFDAFYPGDKYVDYVGINILNYGTVALWSKWWSFQEMFGTHYPELSAFKKPMMITEFGSLAIGGDRSQWIADALSSLPKDYPAVKSVLFFHFSSDQTTTQQAVDWTFKNDPKVLRTIIRTINLWPDSVKPAMTANPFSGRAF